MQKSVILFDFDRTIFDTDKMSRFLTEKIGSILGRENEERIDEIKHSYIKGLKRDREFTPDEFCRRLALHFKNADFDKLIEVFYGEKNASIYSDSVFPEFFQIYKELRDKFRFGIYSEGTLKFQTHKFRSTKLDEYFDKDLIFIVEAKDNTQVLGRIPKSALIVDDKKIICDFLSRNGIQTIWLNKKGEEDSKDFPTIHALLELTGKLM